MLSREVALCEQILGMAFQPLLIEREGRAEIGNFFMIEPPPVST